MDRRPRPPRPPQPPATGGPRRRLRPRAALHAPARPAWRGLLLAFVPPIGELARLWPAFLWAALSVLLLRFVHPPFSVWPLAFVALAPWLWGLRKATPRAAFWISWVFGFAHFLTVYAWLASLSRFNPAIYAGIPLLCAYMGFYYGLQGGLMVWAARRAGPWTTLAFSLLLFGAIEYFRSAGKLGVPFALLSQGVRDAEPLLQLVSLGGAYLLSALLLWINICAMEAAAMARLRVLDPHAVARMALAAGLVVGAWWWGSGVVESIRDREENDSVSMRIALLQPNVDQDEKFAAYSHPDPQVQQALSDRIALDLLGMFEALEPGAFDLVVAPESAFPEFNFDLNAALHREILERAVLLGAPILVGAADLVYHTPDGRLTDDPDEAELIYLLPNGLTTRDPNAGGVPAFVDFSLANAAFLFPPDPEFIRSPAGDYRKVHLMPFGETVPYFGVIPGLTERVIQIGEFVRGDARQPPMFIDADIDPADPTSGSLPVRIAPTICFEDMAPYLHRRASRAGAQVFVNLTNGAWFDPSIGTLIHFEYARMRSAETRLPMVRSTNTGITAHVDAAGRVVDRLPVREEGVLQVVVRAPLDPRPTIYARFGDWFGWLALVLAQLLVLWIWRLPEYDEE